MARDRPPDFDAIEFQLSAKDLYANGTACFAVPLSLVPIIKGALHNLTYPEAWQGELPDVALAIDQIHHFLVVFGTKYTLCECPESEETPEVPTYPIMLDCADCEDCEMSGCSIPYGALRWNNGALEYLYCGVWYPVEGTITNQPDPDGDIITPPPGEIDEATGCSKAYKAAVYLYNLAVIAIAEGDSSTDVWDFYSDVSDQFPNVDLAYNDMARAWIGAVGLDLAGAQGEASEIGLIDYLACYWAPLIADGQDGVTQSEYGAMRDSLKEAMTKYYSDTDAQQWAVWGDLALNFYWWLFQAVGAKDWAKITFGAIPTPGQDCACPEPPAQYSGIVWYDATYTNPIASGGCSLFSAARTLINEARMNMVGGYNANYQECHVIWDLAASGTISELEIECYIEDNPSPLPDYFPSDTYDGASPTPTGQYFKPTVSAGGGTHTYYSPAKNIQRVKITWASPVNLDTATITFPVKFNPKNQAISGGPQTFRIRGKIIYAGPLRA